MMGRNESDRSVLSGRKRLVAAVVGLAMLCPLAIAFLLVPDSRGHGTHEQLGLPPCTMVVLFGIRCPTCGSTTAFAYLARGQLIKAFGANVSATLLALLSVPAGIWVCLSAIRGRWLMVVPSGVAAIVVAMVFLTIAIIDWVCRLLADFL
ncbi:MAG: DUF2752 domain-containing protein [Pirellulales bacterium]|nr:DUF2752 domain-containing protein [Pirellulales bacterium]